MCGPCVVVVCLCAIIAVVDVDVDSLWKGKQSNTHWHAIKRDEPAIAAMIADIFPTLSPTKLKRARHHASAFAAIIAVIFPTICSNRYNNLVLYENSE